MYMLLTWSLLFLVDIQIHLLLLNLLMLNAERSRKIRTILCLCNPNSLNRPDIGGDGVNFVGQAGLCPPWRREDFKELRQKSTTVKKT